MTQHKRREKVPGSCSLSQKPQPAHNPASSLSAAYVYLSIPFRFCVRFVHEACSRYALMWADSLMLARRLVMLHLICIIIAFICPLTPHADRLGAPDG